MTFEPHWTIHPHIAINPRAFVICEGSIYFTERENRLSKHDIISGCRIWSVKVDGAYGDLKVAKDSVYYLTQTGVLNTYCANGGNLLNKKRFDWPRPGYFETLGDIVLTGDCHGHSNLQAHNLKTGATIWSKQNSFSTLFKFSIPSFLDYKRILTVNNSTKRIKILNAFSGVVINEYTLPTEHTSQGYGKFYNKFANEIIFLVKPGKLLKLNIDTLKLSTERLPFNDVELSLPFLDSEKIIIHDTKHSYALVNRDTQDIIWRQAIEHNLGPVKATEINSDAFIIAGSLGTIKFISKDGVVQKLKSENRITTPLYVVEKYLIYGTRGTIECFEFSN